MKLVIRPAAKDDIIWQFRHYLREDALDTAVMFLEAVDESIERLRICRKSERQSRWKIQCCPVCAHGR